jgi:hypothetical protein
MFGNSGRAKRPCGLPISPSQWHLLCRKIALRQVKAHSMAILSHRLLVVAKPRAGSDGSWAASLHRGRGADEQQVQGWRKDPGNCRFGWTRVSVVRLDRHANISVFLRFPWPRLLHGCEQSGQPDIGSRILSGEEKSRCWAGHPLKLRKHLRMANAV